MDLLDRLLAHDSFTTHQLLVASRPLSDSQLDEDFDLGLRTVRATFEHIVRNMEVWTDLMSEIPVRSVVTGPSSIDGLEARLESVSADLAHIARDVRRRGAWDELWIDRLDDPPRAKTFGGAIGHVLTHSMHHRGQVIHMLGRLGVEGLPEGDLLSWERHARGAPQPPR